MDGNHGQSNQKMVTENSAASSSLLNQFILGQLKERQCTNGDLATRNGFVLPKLQVGSPKRTSFIIPQLKLFPKSTEIPLGNSREEGPPLIQQPANEAENKIPVDDDDISAISGGITQMRVNDNKDNTQNSKVVPTTTPAIDLTAALSSVTGIIVRTKPFKPTPVEDFQIPFIECDRQEKPTILLPIMDNYSQINKLSDIAFNGNNRLAKPSSCGRIICLNYRRIQPLPQVKHIFKVKHKIQRFRFDTQSPDDIILASLNKYHRQY